MKHRIQVRERGMRLRLYPDEPQLALLLTQGHNARALWNLLHVWWLMARRDHMATLKNADAAIRQARKDIPWLKLLPAQASQQVLKTYFRAWQDCWNGKSGAPRFKPRKGWLAFDLPQARDLNITALSNRWSTVQVPLVGAVRFRQHRAIPGTVTGARVVREPDGKWFLVLRTKQEIRAANPAKKADQPSVGVDRGITVPLALSDGGTFEHRVWLTPKEQERLHRLECKSARQRRRRRARNSRIGANERNTYTLIACLHSRARRRRADWLHYASRRIADQYSIVGTEALKITNMTKTPAPKPDPQTPGQYLPNGAAAKAGLNKAILGEAWSEFLTLLLYKLLDRAGQLITVPAPNTSLTCHQCRTITAGSRENQATFVCKNQACGWSGNADYNASCNIEIDALTTLCQELETSVIVNSSTLGEGLVLVPARGTRVAVRSADNDADTRPRGNASGGAKPSGKDAEINHGEPFHDTQPQADVA